MLLVPTIAVGLALVGSAPEAPPKDTLPLTGLAPAKLFPDLCKYQYRVTTQSAECQKLCDQAFGFYYSYVWIEAARSFETALRHDPECAMAHWGVALACGPHINFPMVPPPLSIARRMIDAWLTERR